jgi:hypothetical protein
MANTLSYFGANIQLITTVVAAALGRCTIHYCTCSLHPIDESV